ncbi:MAG: hypothetical protein ABSD11_00795 [Methylocella sp.]
MFEFFHESGGETEWLCGVKSLATKIIILINGLTKWREHRCFAGECFYSVSLCLPPPPFSMLGRLWRDTSVLDLSAFILGVAIGIMGVAIITATTITTFIIILTVILLTGTDLAIMAAVMAIMAVVRCRPFKSFSPHACPVRYAAGSAG